MADKVDVLDTPTEEELDILRTQLDVQGQFMSQRSGWITFDGEKYVRQAEG